MKFHASALLTALAAPCIISASSADGNTCPGVNDPPKASLDGSFMLLAQKSDLTGPSMLVGQGSDEGALLWTLEPNTYALSMTLKDNLLYADNGAHVVLNIIYSDEGGVAGPAFSNEFAKPTLKFESVVRCNEAGQAFQVLHLDAATKKKLHIETFYTTSVKADSQVLTADKQVDGQEQISLEFIVRR